VVFPTTPPPPRQIDINLNSCHSRRSEEINYF
jgi:hypothetical protein